MCREAGIDVEVQSGSSFEDGEPMKELYKPGELGDEVEGFDLEGVDLEKDLEYESSWEIN